MIDVYIKRLRAKLDAAGRRLIHTRRGEGYILSAKPERAMIRAVLHSHAVDPLASDETAVEQRAFDHFRQNPAALAGEYRQKFGNEIGADNAREIVSLEYAESKEARTRWSRATQRPAALLSDYLFDEALKHPDPEKPRIVVMTAGGTGAGKTTALRQSPAWKHSQFIYDSNLSSKKSSIQRIEAARAAGNQVKVLFVHRDPVEALIGGVLPRALAEGGIVDLEAHARMYRDAAENFEYLIRKYLNDPNVDLTAFDNSMRPRPWQADSA